MPPLPTSSNIPAIDGGFEVPDDSRLIVDEIINAQLTDAEQHELANLSQSLVYDIPFCPWTPNEGPQSLFLLDFGRESLYGGAAGGGKSIALLMAASQFLDVPGYAALLLRKSYSDLGKPGALMDVADEWWGPLRGHGVRFDSQQHTYEFNCPGGGKSKVVFGALDNENDRFKYQGGAYHFCCQRGTPVFMADQTWRAIEDLRPGDVVATLDGPRPITQTHALGVKPVVAVSTQEGHRLVAGREHRLLVDVSTGSPMQSCADDDIRAASTGSCSESLQLGAYSPSDQQPAGARDVRTVEGTWLRVSDGASGASRSCSASIDATPPTPLQFETPIAHSRAVLYEPALRSSESFGASASRCRACGRELTSTAPASDSRNGYPTCCDCDGARLQPDRVDGPGGTPSPNDARLGSDLEDDPGSTPRDTRSRCTFAHPYTSADQASDDCVVSAGTQMVRAGEAEVFDLTVLGASHYVTWGGIVSANCGFDELTQQKERDYRYIFSRVRRRMEGAISMLPIRFRSTTNPGGVGHEWVYKRFIARWEKWRKGQAPRPRRNFWPALIDDNPKLDRADYVRSLMELDPVTRAQLMRGDWNIRPDGRMFRSRWFRQIKRSQLPGNCVWVRFWDFASTEPSPGIDPDYTVGGLIGKDKYGRIFIADVRRWRKDPGDNDALARKTGLLDTRRVKQVMEQEPGSAGKTAVWHYRQLVFNQSNFQAVSSSGKARGRTTTLVGRKTPPAKIMAAGPFASMASAGMVYVVVDGSWDWESFIAEFEIFPDGEHDDQVDAITLGYNWLMKYGVSAANIGDANEGFEKVNEWRPEALPYNIGEQWEGGRMVEERWSADLVKATLEEQRRVERSVNDAWAI